MEEFNQKQSVSLEWAAMIAGVVIIIVSTYIILGTEWNAYRVINVVIGVAFLTFITYSFTSTRNLKGTLAATLAKAKYFQEELEKSRSTLGETELALKEKEHEVSRLKSNISSMERNIGGLERNIQVLEEGLSDALK